MIIAKISKRAQAINAKVESGKVYSVEEAVALLSELSTVKFKETIEVSLNLGVDPRHAQRERRHLAAAGPDLGELDFQQ